MHVIKDIFCIEYGNLVEENELGIFDHAVDRIQYKWLFNDKDFTCYAAYYDKKYICKNRAKLRRSRYS